MPAPFILPANPTFGTQLAQQLSQGVNKGLEKGIAAGLSGMLQQKKELGKAATNVNLIAKRYGKDAFDAPKLAELQNRTSQLIKEGNLSAQDASLLAFLENDHKSQQEAQQEEIRKSENPGVWDKLKKEIKDKFGFRSNEQVAQNLTEFGQKTAYPFVQAYDFLREAFSPNSAVEQDLRRQGYSEEEIAQSREEIQKDLPGIFKGGPPEPVTPKYLEATGGVGPGETLGERLYQDFLIAGPEGVIIGLFGEAGEYFDAPKNVKIGLEVAGYVTALMKGKVKNAAGKAGNKILTNAEKRAAASGRPVGDVLADAVKESGADLAKVAEGNAAEINKLNRAVREVPVSNESPPIAEKVKATEKTVFNPKEAIKQREAHGRKLEQSPFRENFEIENKKAKVEAGKTPETRAKEAEVAKRIEPKIAQIEKKIDLNRKELARMESYAQKYTGQGKERLNLNIEYQRKAITKQMEELKDLRYELKNGKPRPTETQLEIDAQKGAQKIVDQVKNPTPENLKSFEDQLAKDQRFLERAEAIKKRGEFSKDFKADEHIRINEKYQKAYDAMTTKLRDEINSLKGARDAESLKKIVDNREAIKRLEQRQKRHKANIINQKEKIVSLKSIEGPSGALYKNQIKRVQNDLKEFQKDFAEFKKGAETRAEIGTEHKAQKAIKDSAKEFEKATKIGEEVGKNPTKENIAKAAEETGMKPEEIKTEQKKLGELFKEHAEKVKEGRATERDVRSTEREINKTLGKWNHRLKGTAKSLALSYITGVAKGIIENETGVKIPSSYLTLASTVLGKPTRLPGRFVGLSLGTRTANAFYNSIESSKLKDLRKNPIKYSEYVQNLRKRYSAKRVNEMIEGSKK